MFNDKAVPLVPKYDIVNLKHNGWLKVMTHSHHVIPKLKYTITLTVYCCNYPDNSDLNFLSLVQVGRWSDDSGLNLTKPDNVTFMGGTSLVYDYISQLANKTLRVVLLEEKPFVIVNKDVEDRSMVQKHEVQGMAFCHIAFKVRVIIKL